MAVQNGVYETATGDLLRASTGPLVAGAGETLRADAPRPSKVRGDIDQANMHRWNGSAWIEVAQPAVILHPSRVRVGTTAQRDASTPFEGAQWCNSETGKLEQYVNAAWSAVGGGGGMWSLVESQTLATDAVIDFVLPDSTSWCRFVFARIFLDANNKSLRARVSTDGGSTFIATGTYQYNLHYSEDTTQAVIASAVDTSIWLTRATMRNSPNPTVGIVDYWGNSGAKRCSFHTRLGLDNSAKRDHYSGYGTNTTTTAINAIRFLLSGGNFATGKILMYKNNDIVL